MSNVARRCDCGRYSMGLARFGVIEKTSSYGVTEVHRYSRDGDDDPWCYIYSTPLDDLRWLQSRRQDVPA